MIGRSANEQQPWNISLWPRLQQLQAPFKEWNSLRNVKRQLAESNHDFRVSFACISIYYSLKAVLPTGIVHYCVKVLIGY